MLQFLAGAGGGSAGGGTYVSLWNTIVDMLYTSVVSAFGWFQQILDSAPGAWNAIFTLFVVIVIFRFLLAPLLGVYMSGGSDYAAGVIGSASLSDKAKSNDSKEIVKRED